MRIKAELLNVDVTTRNDSSDQIAVICVKTINPTEYLQVRMFDQSIKNGHLKPFQALVGKEIEFDLSSGIYRDSISYRVFQSGNPLATSSVSPALKTLTGT